MSGVRDKINLIKNSQPIVVDGLYSWTEYKMFKNEYGDRAIIVAVVAPRSLRHKRLSARPVRPLNNKQATDREYSEIEKLEKGGPIANADYYLTNQKDINDLQQAIDRLLIETGIN
jgi:dephospho-CoA kinase